MAMSPSCRRAFVLLPLLSALALCARAEIYWEDCRVEADHPPMNEGDFYNLCIQNHEFIGENFSWKFTNATIEDTSFTDCHFTNRRYSPNNFTQANWDRVEFVNCYFGSVDNNDNQMMFDRTNFANVIFRNCEFHHSVALIFNDFKMSNTTFENCSFTGDTLFSSGQMNDVKIKESSIMHSLATQTRSANESFTFFRITMNDFVVTDSHFVSPMRFHSVDAADVQFNRTTLGEFHCHSLPNKNDDIELRARFNDSFFDSVKFRGDVFCDQTSWRGFYAGNVTFYANADFSSSKIFDIYWDEVRSTNLTGDCEELNFYESHLVRETFANVTVDCIADFRRASFETVYVKRFRATKPKLQKAVFINQEYVDGECCSRACVKLGCLCNVSVTSGNCPIGDRKVNLTAVWSSCFPADAAVRNRGGEVVTMEELAVRESVAVGRGQHSDIFFFGHRAAHERSEFVAIEHGASDKSLRLSPGHYLYVNGGLQVASAVRVGDRLRGVDGDDDVVVTAVGREEGRGLYAPTSIHGDLVVDDVIVSSYTSAIHPGLAHRLLQPLRVMYQYGLGTMVERVTMFEQRSWEGIARMLRLPRGPDAVDV